jgi:steroid 5-alpha reductase family enzyme
MEPLLFNSIVYLSFLLVFVTTVFITAQLKKDNSIMDIVYGPIFFVVGLASYLYSASTSLLAIIILAATLIWSTRLGVRIFKKNRGLPEDARYAAWRTLWMKKGLLYFLLRSYLQINVLQGFVIAIVSLPFIISLSYSEAISLPFVLAGILIFLIGLIIESTADFQLDEFIARKKAGTEAANLMVTGLFRYSRRPNYFGETLIWWGLAIMVLPLPYGWLGLLSPLTITYIVTQVTGPMLENIFIQKYGEQYRAYMKKTSYFIPLPPKGN